MKTINLYFDFEFTGLSPDAQPISLGIVSDDEDAFSKRIGKTNRTYPGKSFYAEFNNFDINRCDDWVKENVVGKTSIGAIHLTTGEPITNKGSHCFEPKEHNFAKCVGNTEQIKGWLKQWLKQFSDYQITFVCDCGTWDFYHLLQLVGEWETNNRIAGSVEYFSDEFGFDSGGRLVENKNGRDVLISSCIPRIGLPKLPSNISPVPFDLNQLIAEKKGVSVGEAFELNREKLAFGSAFTKMYHIETKHNALSDAEVIKEIYNKLK